MIVDGGGGQPITYQVSRMDVSSGRWVPVGVTKTPEMDVTGLNEGKSYLFKVVAVVSLTFKTWFRN